MGGYKGDKGGFGGGFGGGGNSDGRAIYVNGFDFGASEAQLLEHFGYVGTIDSLNFQGQGAAIIRFTDAGAAQRAVSELDRTTMNGHSRYCSVKIDGERKGKGKGKKY